jgi:hypothetical protein
MNIKRKSVKCFILAGFILSSCSENNTSNKLRSSEQSINASPQYAHGQALCPNPDFSPEQISIERDDESDGDFVDISRDFKDLGTDFVIQSLFNSEESLYRFMKTVYQTIDEALTAYRKEHKLEDRALFFLFKGGNVLRMVANEVFDQLSPDARNFLHKEYAQYFKRSDADFSVYIDEKKLGGLDYDLVFRQVSQLIFTQLGKIRNEFNMQPEKYFDFFRLNALAGSTDLSRYFAALNGMPAISDPTNKNWYNAQFIQMQFLDQQAEAGPKCFYRGQYDYLYQSKDNKVIATRLTDDPNWIYNTDNKTLEWKWGSDLSKTVKFSLLRSKVALEYVYKKDNLIKRKPVGGELIDVSIPHRSDDRLREFLDNYDNTVADYTLISEETNDEFTLKAYSFANLVEDLQFILLDSFDRPWSGGPKYAKRVNRLFFLFNIELLSVYGLTPGLRKYLNEIKEKIITPLHGLYSNTDQEAQKKLLTELKFNQQQIADTWPKLTLANHFWASFTTFIERIIKGPEEDDKEGLDNLLDIIEKNINLTKELTKLRSPKLNQEELYNVETKNLF